MKIPATLFDQLVRESEETLALAHSVGPDTAAMTRETIMGGTIVRAMNRVFDATPAERVAMMKFALPSMEDQTTRLPEAEVHSALIRRFAELIQAKSLNGDVLLTGALMVELGIAKMPEDPPLPSSCKPADE